MLPPTSSRCGRAARDRLERAVQVDREVAFQSSSDVVLRVAHPCETGDVASTSSLPNRGKRLSHSFLARRQDW